MHLYCNVHTENFMFNSSAIPNSNSGDEGSFMFEVVVYSGPQMGLILPLSMFNVRKWCVKYDHI